MNEWLSGLDSPEWLHNVWRPLDLTSRVHGPRYARKEGREKFPIQVTQGGIAMFSPVPCQLVSYGTYVMVGTALCIHRVAIAPCLE